VEICDQPDFLTYSNRENHLHRLQVCTKIYFAVECYEPDSPEAERHARLPLKGDFSKIQVVYGGIDTAKFRPLDAAKMREELGLKPGEYAFAAGDYGQLVKPESVDELAAAMLAWAQRPALSPTERESLRTKVAEQFSVLAFGKGMLDFYRGLMKSAAVK
jgi:glycosyltransferase involved in cell wall biosynthesis